MAVTPDVHPRIALHLPARLGERASDVVVAGMGSWRFVIIQSIVVTIWIAANVWLLTTHAFDPFPFILLNLAFSTQAAYASPLILMAANRQASKDRARDDLEASEVDQMKETNDIVLRLSRQLVAVQRAQVLLLHAIRHGALTSDYSLETAASKYEEEMRRLFPEEVAA